MTGGDFVPFTGVWWDLNTCPVPDGFDPRNVRRSIESALRKMIGEPRRVEISAVGNLEYVSPQVLKALSDSGILIKHAVFGGNSLFYFLIRWSEHTPPPGEIMLISCNPSWLSPSAVPYGGYTFFRAHPKTYNPPAYLPSWGRMCHWETLLEENLDESWEDKHVYGPDWFCYICDIYDYGFESCESFVNHLKSDEHKQELFESVALNEKGVPLHFCSLCKYPGYDEYNMDIHYNSDEHKQNEEEEKKLKKKRIGEPSLNESFKLRQESGSGSGSSLSKELEEKLQITPTVPPASSKAATYPVRPGFGQAGKKVTIRANHFLVQVADRDLYHYDVSITPEVISKKVNRDVMTTLVRTYGESQMGKKIPAAYDGRKSLYTAGALPFESKEFVVDLNDKKPAGSSK